MKNAFYLAYFILFAAFGSCKKDDSSAPQEIQRTWSYADTTMKAAYADVNTRNGYHISFRPEGAAGTDYGITFRFAEKPAAGQYSVTPNTPGPAQVAITLENGVDNVYTPAAANQEMISVTYAQSKFSLGGDNIRMVRKTGVSGVDSLTLSFRLSEF